MYRFEDIRHVHLELSSLCNASCPLCPRNFYGYPFNDGYIEHNMTVHEAKKIFSPEFLKQISTININGNFGDIVMNPHTLDIVEYFKTQNGLLHIVIDTNGGARNARFWRKLASLGAVCRFSIDGLEDTNHLYRQNVVWSTVMRNVRNFNDAGGKSIWKFIPFEHNQHQIEQARVLSQTLGFQSFELSDYGRNTGPVFNKNGQLVHVMGKPSSTEFPLLFRRRTTDHVLLEDIVVDRQIAPISCHVKKQKSVYISSTGHVFPCCKVGFSPDTFGHGNYFEPANKQVAKLIKKNNALENPLEECIKWFVNVEKSWEIPEFNQGRLIICQDVCGQSQ